MNELESRDGEAPEEGIDFTRLRAIRAELVRLTRFWQNFLCHSNDLSLGFIPSLTFNVYIFIDFPLGSVAPGASQGQVWPLVTWVLQHWSRLFPHSIGSEIVFFLSAFGFAILLLVIRNGITLAIGRKMESRLRQELAQSQLLSRFIDGWDELPDITTYVHRKFRSFIMWPAVLREKPSPLQQQVRFLVNNLDWYVKPPKRLIRWQWINAIVRAVTGVLCLLAQFGMLFTGGGYNQPVSPAWSICLLVMLGSYIVFLLTCLLSAIVPFISVATRARILLNKLQPVFEILGPEPAGRSTPRIGAAG
jgi:hypothetical protein